MGNNILTINMITREAVRLFKNSNEFIRNIDTQYDNAFSVAGAKIGQSVRIRLPNDYTVRHGAAASIQDTQEQSTTLNLQSQIGVDVAFDSVERSMSLDDYSIRVLAPAINATAGDLASGVMSSADGGIANYYANVDGSSNIISPIADTWLNAGALLDLNSAPRANRKVIMDPVTQARTVSSLTGLFNPTVKISDQYETGMMGANTLGFRDWYYDQTVIKHTTGAYVSNPTVHGAGQTGLTLVVNALAGPLKAGDIISIAGVNGVNRVTKDSTGQVRQFVLTANAAGGATSLSIYPGIVPAVAGNKVQYQTVDVSPADTATITPVSKTGEVYRKNFVYVPEAVTMATADLELPKGVHEAARAVYDGISLRMVTAYDVRSDDFITRLDVIYGYLWIRPEWATVVPDKI